VDNLGKNIPYILCIFQIIPLSLFFKLTVMRSGNSKKNNLSKSNREKGQPNMYTVKYGGCSKMFKSKENALTFMSNIRGYCPELYQFNTRTFIERKVSI